jgi:teichuronic acid biosynthesis glycosyltransferase TuaC
LCVTVLHVANLWPDEERPWYGTFVKSQVDSLSAIGVDVDVLRIRGYARRSAYVRAAARVVALNRRADVDVVHAHYGHSGVVARLELRAPLVITFYGSDLLGRRSDSGVVTPRGHIEAAVFRQLARAAAATITNSEAMERVLPPSRRRRNHVIPTGVDLARFQPVDRLSARRRLGWPPDEQCVLFAANPRLGVKNYALAESVCRRAAEVVPRLRLRVASGLAPSEMPLWMSAADVLLLTSRSEGSPNVVKEAMASELPIVSTPVGDVPERLRGLPGCFVRPAEEQPLADAVVEAMRHGRVPEARVAVASLSLERVARRIAKVYEAVA